VLPLLLLSIVPSVMRRRWMVIGAIVLVAAVLLSRTPLGHAASDGPWTLREAVQFVHLVSVCVWGGGVLIAGLVVLPGLSSLEDAPVAVSVAGRLSRTVTIALVGVVLSGVYNSWRGTGGHVAPLTQTSWGEMLLAKVLLVLVALCLGARVRLMLQARSTPASARVLTMGRWMRMEAVVMIVVLILSAWLANLSPAGDMGDMAINPHGDHQVRACPLLAASEDVVA
jgi:putative copper resistance protein D